MTIRSPRGAFQRNVAKLALWLALAVTTLVVSGCDETATGRSDAASEPGAVDVSIDTTLEERPSIDADDVSDASLDVTADGVFMDALGDAAPDSDAGPGDFYGDCTVPRVDVPDAAPACVPERTSSCACVGGAVGNRTCLEDQTWSACQCPPSDAGPDPIVPAVPPGTFTPVPTIPGPRLLAPQSGSRVTTQRPTFRWRMPDGTTRARIELCADRPCARMLAQEEVSGASWQPTELLSAGVVFWRVRGLDAAGAVNWMSATWEFGVPHRNTPVDTSYGVLKDFNGDNYDDIVVQAGGRLGTGTVRVYPGGSGGIDERRVRFIDPPHPWSMGGSGFGEVFASGDLNGDGLSDLVVGDDLYLELISNGGRALNDGRVYVFYGSRTCVLSPSDTSLRPSQRGRPFGFGYDLSAGDFNGDGYADVLVTGEDGVEAEGLKLHPGGPRGPLSESGSGISVGGRTAQFVGDLNGDGYEDILARTVNYQERGLNDFALVVLYGNPEGQLDFHVQYIDLPFRSRLFKWIIRWGDVNEDSYADAVVSFNGYVYIFYGSSEGIRRFRQLDTPPDTAGGSGSPSFGIGLSFPADVDGDGHAELLAGAAAARVYDGQVYLFTSIMGDLSMMWSTRIAGPAGLGQQFSVAAIPGDVNGDGFNDVAIGAPADRFSYLGRVYVYHGEEVRWWGAPRVVIAGPYCRNVQ